MKKLTSILIRQLKIYWDITDKNVESIENVVDSAIRRALQSFEKVASSYFSDSNSVNPIHTVQYAIFLYYLSNELYKQNSIYEASVVYYLNKVMHGVDWFYAIELPEHFAAEHPLSSVLGRAEYGDYFFCYQGTTVGGNGGNYPKMGENNLLYANATVIGNSRIGDNVIISANTYIKDEIIPSNCIVFGMSPNINIKEKNKDEILSMMKHIWKNI